METIFFIMLLIGAALALLHYIAEAQKYRSLYYNQHDDIGLLAAECRRLQHEMATLRIQKKASDAACSKLAKQLADKTVTPKASVPINGHFTQEELKRIRFAVHPDKNRGKTGELFIKVNKMLGE